VLQRNKSGIVREVGLPHEVLGTSLARTTKERGWNFANDIRCIKLIIAAMAMIRKDKFFWVKIVHRRASGV
jgi:hypothetical protein